jgi:hypothetical protein
VKERAMQDVQSELFGDADLGEAPTPSPIAMEGAMADNDDMVQIILDDGDQQRCARTMARRFPTAAKDDIVAIINWAEPQLYMMGFAPSLSVLRIELERVHPAWR